MKNYLIFQLIVNDWKEDKPGGLKLALLRRGLSLGRRLGYRVSVKLWKAAVDGRTCKRFPRNVW